MDSELTLEKIHPSLNLFEKSLPEIYISKKFSAVMKLTRIVLKGIPYLQNGHLVFKALTYCSYKYIATVKMKCSKFTQ